MAAINETNCFEKHVPMGIHASCLSCIHVEKSCFQTTSLKPLGFLNPYFMFSMQGKVEEKFVVVFLCNSGES